MLEHVFEEENISRKALNGSDQEREKIKTSTPERECVRTREREKERKRIEKFRSPST